MSKSSIIQLIAALICLIISEVGIAQNNPPVIYYSRMTSSFDRNLPVGKDFQIKGSVNSNTLAVKVESFGYFKSDKTNIEALKVLLGESSTMSVCEAIRQVRMRSDILVNTLAWEKPQSGGDEFVVNHPRLYYGRSYVFLFSYYQPLNQTERDQLSAEVIRASFDQIIQALDIDQSTTPQQMTDMISRTMNNVLTNINLGGCKSYINRFSLQEIRNFSSVITNIANAYQEQSLLDMAIREKALSKLNNWVNLDYYQTIENALRAAEVATATADVNKLRTLVEAQSWNPAYAAGLVISAALAANPSQQQIIQNLNSILSDLDYSTANLTGLSNDVIISRAAGLINVNLANEMLSSAGSRPFIDTNKEKYKFLISLDGGLGYVADFEEVIPSVDINIKIPPIRDFDDPLSNKVEPSFILGLGMAAPSDLDPDYRGFRGLGQRSLITGLGVRIPQISPLIRFQVSALWYQQQSKDPFEKKLNTQVSWYYGASLNWDALDFILGLFNNRTNFNIN